MGRGLGSFLFSNGNLYHAKLGSHKPSQILCERGPCELGSPWSERKGMRIKKLHALVLAICLCVFLHIAIYDRDAFFLLVILVPLGCLFLYVSVRCKQVVLSLFLTFFVLSHSVNPAFFFLRRETYARTGWNAVRDFKFSLPHFLTMYFWVYLVMGLIVLLTLMLSAIMSPRIRMRRTAECGSERRLFGSATKREERRCSCLLVGFILLVAIPMTIFMYRNQIGIVGLIPPKLPFKLVGGLYYFRFLVAPIVILWLYAKSTRSLMMAGTVLTYAVIAGVTSVSRSTLLIASFPVVIFSVLDRNHLRLVLCVLLCLVAFQGVSMCRSYVYAFRPIVFSELVGMLKWSLVFDVLAAITGRLSGAQDVVLAYQYDLWNQSESIVKFFMAQPVMHNYAREIYGFNMPQGRAFGIGFGALPWLVLLANENVLVLLFLATVSAILLFAAEMLVRTYLLCRTNVRLMAYPLAFFFAYNLYQAQLKLFYYGILIFSAFLVCRKGAMAYGAPSSLTILR